jgi:hypothetical protein
MLLAVAMQAGHVAPAAAQSQSKATSHVYSCVTAQGRRLTSDRPIPECNDRDQRLLGRDGTVLRVVPPTLTAEERAAKEAAEQRAAAERAKLIEAARMDRNLMRRYPNEAAHNKARAGALSDVQAALAGSKMRLEALAEERKPLDTEAEFYKGKTLPPLLKRKIDANDAARQAVLESQVNNAAELERVGANYDKELDRLRKLWAGAPAGQLGALVLAEKPPEKKAPSARPVAPQPAKPAAKPAAKPTASPVPTAASANAVARSASAATVKR